MKRPVKYVLPVAACLCPLGLIHGRSTRNLEPGLAEGTEAGIGDGSGTASSSSGRLLGSLLPPGASGCSVAPPPTSDGILGPDLSGGFEPASGADADSASLPCADVASLGTALFANLCSDDGSGSGSGAGSGAGGSSNANVLVSPLSIAQSLALLAAGTTPDSAAEAELLAALGSPSTVGHGGVPSVTAAVQASARTPAGGLGGAVEAAAAALGAPASLPGPGVSLSTASSIWLHDSIHAEFEAKAEAVHGASARPLPATYGPINDWVEEATHGEVRDLFDSSEPVDPLTRAALINAVYFRGSWTHRFDVAKTELGTFRKRAGTGAAAAAPALPASGPATASTSVKYMKDKRIVPVHPSHGALGGAQVVRLDYGERRTDPRNGWELPADFAALFVLPANVTVEAEMEAVRGLTGTSLSSVLSSLFPRQVDLSIPKFRLEWGATSIKEALKSVGVSEVFEGTGSLMGMSDDPDLHLSDALHKAVMEVTEEGTVASAATGMQIMTRSLPPPPMEIKFDRPFLMAVVHTPTGTPLFLGRVTDPRMSFEEKQ